MIDQSKNINGLDFTSIPSATATLSSDTEASRDKSLSTLDMSKLYQIDPKYIGAIQELTLRPIHSVSNSDVMDDIDDNVTLLSIPKEAVMLITDITSNHLAQYYNNDAETFDTDLVEAFVKKQLESDYDIKLNKNYLDAITEIVGTVEEHLLYNEEPITDKSDPDDLIFNRLLVGQYNTFLKGIPWDSIKDDMKDHLNQYFSEFTEFNDDLNMLRQKVDQAVNESPGYTDNKFKSFKKSSNRRLVATHIKSHDKVFTLLKTPDDKQRQSILQEAGDDITKKNLGRGSFGYVQLARDTATKELVAVKIFNDKNSNVMSAEEVEQLNKLGDNNYLLSYRGSAKHIQSNSHDKNYIFMNYAGSMDGKKVISAIKHSGQSPEFRASYMEEIAKEFIRAVNELHSKNLFHHDIKPENFVVSKEDSSTLIDFGFTGPSINKATKGTPLYMPPEAGMALYESEKHDAFSLGLTMLELKLQSLPYQHKGPHLNIKDGESITLRFGENSKRCYGIKSDNRDEIKGETLDEVIALLLLRNPAKRLSVKEAFQLPFFQNNRGS